MQTAFQKLVKQLRKKYYKKYREKLTNVLLADCLDISYKFLSNCMHNKCRSTGNSTLPKLQNLLAELEKEPTTLPTPNPMQIQSAPVQTKERESLQPPLPIQTEQPVPVQPTQKSWERYKICPYCKTKQHWHDSRLPFSCSDRNCKGHKPDSYDVKVKPMQPQEPTKDIYPRGGAFICPNCGKLQRVSPKVKCWYCPYTYEVEEE